MTTKSWVHGAHAKSSSSSSSFLSKTMERTTDAKSKKKTYSWYDNFHSWNCCRKGRGECYAIASMRKVELELEFNFLSGSDFLSRLVR